MSGENFGSSEAASKGGKARAKSLPPEKRRQIARQAVEARWKKAGKTSALPVAKFGSFDHPMRIGDLEIPCFVLGDGRRVLTLKGFLAAMGMSKGGSDKGEDGNRLSRFLSGKAISPFVSDAISRVTADPIRFQLPSYYTGETRAGNDSWAYGFEATLLADVCEAVLLARDAGALQRHQLHIAVRCDFLVRSFAKVGIIALVDEATGYQYDRPQRDLQEQLKKFLSEGLVRYASGFPHDYLKNLCRLKGVELRPDMRLPQYFGHITNDLVYRRIAPGLVKALKGRRAERGKKSHKLYNWTSEDHGYPALMIHLGKVVAYMEGHTDFDAFKKLLDERAPVYPEVPGLFDDAGEWGEPSK